MNVKKENPTKKSTRNLGLDLLKILSIIFVVFLHYNCGKMGGLIRYVETGTVNYYISLIGEIFAVIACNLFVIISGYYLCNDNNIKIRKIVDIIILLIFYGVAIYLISLKTGITIFNENTFKLLFRSINARWFVNIYILLYILHPFINKIIHSINKRKLEILVLICIFFFSLWSSILEPSGYISLTEYVNDSGYGIINFIMLYLIGAYINLYKDDYKPNKLILLGIYIVLSVIGGLLYTEYPEVDQYNFIINIINTVVLFLLFKNLNIQKSKLIPVLSSTSLAVYIIHENPFIRQFIYRNIFKETLFYNSKYLIPHIIITVFSIFIICAIIELIRKFIFKKTIDKIVDKSKLLNSKVEI